MLSNSELFNFPSKRRAWAWAQQFRLSRYFLLQFFLCNIFQSYTRLHRKSAVPISSTRVRWARFFNRRMCWTRRYNSSLWKSTIHSGVPWITCFHDLFSQLKSFFMYVNTIQCRSPFWRWLGHSARERASSWAIVWDSSNARTVSIVSFILFAFLCYSFGLYFLKPCVIPETPRPETIWNNYGPEWSRG